MARERFIVCLFALRLLLCPCVLTSPCSPGWERVGKKCYHLLTTAMPWGEADKRCRGLGGSLAVPDSKMEQDAIWGIVTKYFGSTFPTDDVWIGCLKKEGTWHCIGHDGEASPFRDWGDGQPNDYGWDPICARMASFDEGRWWDKSCALPYNAMCETTVDDGVRPYCTVTDDKGRIASRCLTRHVISEFPFKSVIACGSACRDEPRCRSFNVRDASQDTGNTCQLNDMTRQEAKQDEFVDEENCYYFDL